MKYGFRLDVVRNADGKVEYRKVSDFGVLKVLPSSRTFSGPDGQRLNADYDIISSDMTIDTGDVLALDEQIFRVQDKRGEYQNILICTKIKAAA